ncbi:hypothetical protein [Deinococcus pimensis]|uniref:hypothetical protein n=1 Tax=Deinococcus pimensis TaxID=309888 RepID=UPI0004842B36|nr:hypothetical protein [Deinococcus pimensis]
MTQDHSDDLPITSYSAQPGNPRLLLITLVGPDRTVTTELKIPDVLFQDEPVVPLYVGELPVGSASSFRFQCSRAFSDREFRVLALRVAARQAEPDGVLGPMQRYLMPY